MIPILYEKSETEFSGNGICRLRDATSALVTEERNGIYECSFSYPVNGSNYSQITPGRIIAVEHDTTGDIQPFDIIGFTKPINGVVTFHAVHVSYRLSKSVTRGTNITSLGSAINMLREAVPTNPFVYYPDLYDRTGYLASADGTPRTVREFLGGVEGSILDTYGGEYEWDKFTVYLHPERGQRRDLVVRYGVNLVDYEEEYDGLEVYNAVIPFWKGQDSAQNDTFVVGAMQSSGMAVSSGRTECAALDVTDKFETQPTQAQVEAMGLKVMSETQPFLPIRNFRIDFENENNEYAGLHKCNLCDTIRVVFPRYGMDGYFKIVKVTYDVLQERYTEIELGNLSTSLSEALGIGSGTSGSGSSGGGGITVLDCYPVGSYYETSDSSFDPNTAWGGTWVLDSKGRVTVSRDETVADFDTIGETGGEKTHTLTVDEMPSHTHKDGTSASVAYAGSVGTNTAQVAFDANSGRATTATGGGQAHNNMPPYVVVNRWHRTA